MLPAPLTPQDVALTIAVFLVLFVLGIALTHPRRGSDWLFVLTVAGLFTPVMAFLTHELVDRRHWWIATLGLLCQAWLAWIIVSQNREIRLHRINKWLRHRSAMRRGEESEQVS